MKRPAPTLLAVLDAEIMARRALSPNAEHDSPYQKEAVQAMRELRALLAVARAAVPVIVLDYESPRFRVGNEEVRRLNRLLRALDRLARLSSPPRRPRRKRP